MADDAGHIRVDRPAAHVARLVFDRQSRSNALSPIVASGLRDVVMATSADPSVHVILLRGGGDRSFCGGFDLAGLEPGVRDDELLELVTAIRSAAVPTVAVVNGHAVGAGLALACACDLRVVRRGAKVGLPAVRLGVAYDAAGVRDVLAVAPSARRLLLTGELVAAEELAGFADVLVDAGEIDDRSLVVAGEIAAAAPASVAYMTAIVRSPTELNGYAPDDLGRRRRAILDGPDVKEALNARRDGRAPRFTPRPGRG